MARFTENVGYSNLPDLIFNFWLTLYPDGDMKMSRGEPGVERTGRKMKMRLVVPKAIFKTPELKATITIADPGEAGYEVDATAAAEALRSALGVDIDVQVITPSTPE